MQQDQRKHREIFDLVSDQTEDEAEDCRDADLENIPDQDVKQSKQYRRQYDRRPFVLEDVFQLGVEKTPEHDFFNSAYRNDKVEQLVGKLPYFGKPAAVVNERTETEQVRNPKICGSHYQSGNDPERDLRSDLFFGKP